MKGNLGLSGKLGCQRVRAPRPGLRWKLGNWRAILPGLLRWYVSKMTGAFSALGTLHAVLIKGNGERVNYGLVSTKLVTTAFVEYVVDQLTAEDSAFGDFKFHDSGIGVTGAAIGDTDIETTDGESRVTGDQGEGASGEIYKSIGTITYSTTKAITEHGLFNIVTGGIMMDHHVFSAINVVDTDSIQFTFELTCAAGG